MPCRLLNYRRTTYYFGGPGCLPLPLPGELVHDWEQEAAIRNPEGLRPPFERDVGCKKKGGTPRAACQVSKTSYFYGCPGGLPPGSLPGGFLSPGPLLPGPPPAFFDAA